MNLKGSINTKSHIPYYFQLMELLREQIHNDVWHPGEQIPSELELCEGYKISRTVVRQALGELEIQGLIEKKRGKGSFIAHPKINEGLIQKLTGFYQDMVERGFKPETKVLHQEVVTATETIAKYLNIDINDEVTDIERLRFINDEPIQLVTTYIPVKICPSLSTVDLTNRSLYEYLEKEFGIIITRGKRYLEAVLASKPEAIILGVDKGDPLIKLDSISYDQNDQVIEYYHALHRGDRSRFEVELIRLEEQK